MEQQVDADAVRSRMDTSVLLPMAFCLYCCGVGNSTRLLPPQLGKYNQKGGWFVLLVQHRVVTMLVTSFTSLSPHRSPPERAAHPSCQMCYISTQNWYFRCCYLAYLSFICYFSYCCLDAVGFAGLCSPKDAPYSPLTDGDISQLLVAPGAPGRSSPSTAALSDFAQLLLSLCVPHSLPSCLVVFCVTFS